LRFTAQQQRVDEERRLAAATKTSRLDLLRDIKRLNDHLVAGAAYLVLEASGDLTPSTAL
jgi:Na+/phosphate symporter